MLGEQVGDPVRHVRDDIDRKGKIINVLLEPSQAHFFHKSKCSANEVTQTRRDFF